MPPVKSCPDDEASRAAHPGGLRRIRHGFLAWLKSLPALPANFTPLAKAFSIGRLSDREPVSSLLLFRKIRHECCLLSYAKNLALLKSIRSQEMPKECLRSVLYGKYSIRFRN